MNIDSPKLRTSKLSTYALVHLDIPRPSCPHEQRRPTPTFSCPQAQWFVPVISRQLEKSNGCALLLHLWVSIGGYIEPVAQLPTPPLSPINPLTEAPMNKTRPTRLLRPTLSQKRDEASVFPLKSMTSTPPPDLPSELLDQILSFLPLSVLPVAMRTSQLFHAIAERQLYFKVHCIDFFPHVHQQRCLETIANRPSAAQSVRHFGVRGLPWLEDGDVVLLSSALRAMTRLLSLDINLGAPPEHDLLHPDPPLSPDLEALNVVDPFSAKYACEGGNRPIRLARIASSMDICTAQEVIPALAQSSGPLRQLQISLQVSSMDEAIEVLQLLSSKLPSLHTLGVEIRAPKNIDEQDFETNLEEVGLALSGLSQLSTLSIVLPSFRRTGTLEDVRTISSPFPKLVHLELQWGGWSLVDNDWKEKQSWHGLMRRGWLYPHAREPIIRS